MALRSLLKSEKEREKDKERARRRVLRQAENSVEVVKEWVSMLKKKRDTAWGDARRYLRDGENTAARRSLQTVRATEILCAKLEMKRWVFEDLLRKLELAKTDEAFNHALTALNTVVQIDHNNVTNVLGEVEEKLGEQMDTDKIWEKLHGKEMESVKTNLLDVVPSMEEMTRQLEDEVAADLESERSLKAKGIPEKKPCGTEPAIMSAFCGLGNELGWDDWTLDARQWFAELGMSVNDDCNRPTPKKEFGRAIEMSGNTHYYHLCHGDAEGFMAGDGEFIGAEEIEKWLQAKEGMAFAFVGSCMGLSRTGRGTLASTFLKSDSAPKGRCAVGYVSDGRGYESSSDTSWWTVSLQWQHMAFYLMMTDKMPVREAFKYAEMHYPASASIGGFLVTGR